MRRLLASFYFSQLPMALSAALFLWHGAALEGRRLAAGWYLAAFAGTWAVYLYDAGGAASGEDIINSPQRRRFFERHRSLRRAVPACALFIAAAAILTTAPSFAAGALAALIGISAALYTLRRIPMPGGALRLKDFGWLKDWVVSLAWLLGGLALPWLEGEALPSRGPDAPMLIVGLFLFLMLMIDTVMLDWRDRAGDRAAGIRTLAVSFGVRTPALLWAALALAAALWALGLALGDLRWGVVGAAMGLSLAAAVAGMRFALRSEALYGSLAMLWRWSGAAALLLLRK